MNFTGFFKKRYPAFSLVEMGIVLIIMGAVLAVVWPMVHTLQQTQRHRATQEHQDLVVRSLAAYVLKERRLPCPARSGTGLAESACDGVTIGIVPFQTLGLSEKVAKNGAGNYFSYAVDAVLTRRFPRINISDPESREVTFCNAAREESFIKLIKNGHTIPNASLQDMLAFVLISHEKGGNYNASLSRTALRSPTVEQSENINDDATFDISEGVDRVTWLTRNNLMASYAKEVCR